MLSTFHCGPCLALMHDGEPAKDFSSDCGHTHPPDAMVFMLV
jgi:hypothetical protein